MLKKKDKNPVVKVVFYEIEHNGKIVKEAAIFRKDGVYIGDKEDGIDALYELAKQKRFKTIKELEEANSYEVLSEEMLKEKFSDIYETAKDVNSFQEEKEEEIEEEQEPEEKKKKSSLSNILDKFHIKNFLARASITALAGGFALFGGIHLGKKLFNHSPSKKTTTQEDKNNKNDFSTENISDESESNKYETATEMLEKYGTVDSILEHSNINPTKANTLSNIWSYLKDYNQTISNQHVSSKSSTQLAHTWDEVIVNYFAYNDISKDEVSKVFDNYDIDINTWKDAYKNGYNQDILLYTVIEEPTNKVNLIQSQEGKDFYRKYEDLMIEYNKNYDKENEESKIVNKFYKTIREDFDTNESIKDIESYKLSVIPIIYAFDSILENRDFDNKLTSSEKTYFDSLADYSQIEDKINDLSKSLYSYNLAVSALDENQEEYTYSQIKDAAILELSNNNAYNVSEENRDISDHNEYKEKFMSVEEQTTENTSSNTNNYTNNSSNSNVDNAGMIEDNEKEDKIPDWMLEENEQEDVTIEETQETVETTQEEPEVDNNIDVYEVEEDTPNTIEVENDTDYENTDDSIKNITIDDTNVSPNEPLPDPNNNDIINNYQSQNEVVANYIVEEMANNPATSNINYQYIKK